MKITLARTDGSVRKPASDASRTDGRPTPKPQATVKHASDAASKPKKTPTQLRAMLHSAALLEFARYVTIQLDSLSDVASRDDASDALAGLLGDLHTQAMRLLDMVDG